MRFLPGAALALFVCLVIACGGGSSSGDSSTSGAMDAGADGTPTTLDGSALDASTSDASSGDAATADASGSLDAAFDASSVYPAPHDAPPQVLSYGGPTLAAPRIIPIFYQNDPMQTQIEQFLTELAASSYWAATTAEYAVGALTIAPSIVVTDTPPEMTTDDQIKVWLAGYLDGTHPEWPVVAPGNIYMAFFLSTTTITYGSGASLETTCTSVGGYHSEWEVGGFDAGAQPFVYAVIPQCATFGSLHGIDAVTDGASHEAVESATDPFPYTRPAYYKVDAHHTVWSVLPLAEVGDMCAYEPQSDQRLVGNFLVQRIWSNHAAMAGGDPCVPPLTNAVYFNAAPELTETVSLIDQGETYPTLGVSIPPGQSATVNIRFFSTGPTADWSVYLLDSSSAYAGPSLLTYSPAVITGNNGDVVPVTITATSTTSLGGVEMVLQVLRPSDPSTINYWFGFVAE